MYQMQVLQSLLFATQNDTNTNVYTPVNSESNNTSIWNNPQACQSDERLKVLKSQIEELREENIRLNKEFAALQVKPSEKNDFSLTKLASFSTELNPNMTSKTTKNMIKNSEITSNKVISSYGKTVSISKLEDVYNKDLSEKLAQQSQIETAGRTKTTGWCAKYVNNAFEDLGLVTKNSTRCASAYMLENILDENASFKRVDVSRDKIKDLPPGCVVVWQKGEGYGSEFSKHGHIFITQGNGKATSDYEQNIKDYGTKFAVFVPVTA